MKRLATLAAACVAALTPAPAPAAIELRFGQPEVIAGVPDRYGVDVFAVGTDAEDEQLFAYDLGFVLEPTSPSTTPRSIGFVPPYAARPAEDFVFGDDPASFAVSPSPAPGLGAFLLSVHTEDSELPDITGPVRVATVYLAAAPGGITERYTLRFDEDRTEFLSGDSDFNPVINIDASGVLFIVPEPSAAGLAAAACLLTLRRRRHAGPSRGKA